jgi:hypothetical protein
LACVPSRARSCACRQGAIFPVPSHLRAARRFLERAQRRLPGGRTRWVPFWRRCALAMDSGSMRERTPGLGHWGVLDPTLGRETVALLQSSPTRPGRWHLLDLLRPGFATFWICSAPVLPPSGFAPPRFLPTSGSAPSWSTRRADSNGLRPGGWRGTLVDGERGFFAWLSASHTALGPIAGAQRPARRASGGHTRVCRKCRVPAT